MKKIIVNEDSSLSCFEDSIELNFQERSKIGMRYLDVWRNTNSSSISPAPDELIFRIVEFLPNTKKILMHKTNSLDCAVVLEGNIRLVLENQDIDLCQGDCIVQKSNPHAWVNFTSEPCKVLFFMKSQV